MAVCQPLWSFKSRSSCVNRPLIAMKGTGRRGLRIDCDDQDADEEESSGNSYLTGVVLSVVADAIIAISLNVQKYAHNRNRDPATEKPVVMYIKLPLWASNRNFNLRTCISFEA